MKRFLIIILSLVAAISLATLVVNIKFRIERRGWLITTAEITFIGLPDGIVFGTFTDYNGKVHSEYYLYLDGRFQRVLNPMPLKPETYVGRTVRIMYDPSTVESEGPYTITTESGHTITPHRYIDIESYDNWLRYMIGFGIAFAVSCTPIVVVCVKAVRKKKAQSDDAKTAP